MNVPWYIALSVAGFAATLLLLTFLGIQLYTELGVAEGSDIFPTDERPTDVPG